MAVVSMKQLLEAGVHFGHQTRRWNPKMAKFIFTERNGIYIIDLSKTVKKVEEAYSFLREVASQGEVILFVGTKKQAQEAIKEEAVRANMFFVNERWLGGMLTNFKTIETRIKRLKQLEAMAEDGTFEVLPKKEVIGLRHEMEKLEKYLGGIKDMPKMPGALFVVDPKKEKIAIAEAKKLGIPVVATVDTNCDPDEVEFPIPANDDAIRAVKLLAGKMADAVLEGRQGESLDGAEAVYTKEGREQTRANIAYYKENARIIKEGLESIGLTVYGGVDAPYIWLKTPGNMTSWELFDILLEQVQIVSTPGSGFGPHGEGYLRLTAFGSRENTIRAVERIKTLQF